MFFYIALFVICICLFYLGKSKRNAKLSFILLWAVYAFRDNVGVDDGNYIKAFEYLGKGWTYDIEWSYQKIAELARMLGLNYKFIFLVYSTIALIALYKAVDLLFDTNAKKAMYMICFFGTVFVSSMSVMRQFTAACICFYGVAYMYKNKSIKKPIILCLIAMIFHGGAVLAIPFLFLIRPEVELKYSHKILIVVLSAVCGYANIAGLLLQTIMSFLPISYQIYANSISGSFSSAGGTISLLMLILFVGQSWVSMKSKKNQPDDPMYVVMEKGQLLYLSLLFFFVHAGVASRLAFTFLPFIATIPITFSQRIVKYQRSIMRMAITAAMLILYIMAINSTATTFSGAFIPYNASFDFFES